MHAVWQTSGLHARAKNRHMAPYAGFWPSRVGRRFATPHASLDEGSKSDDPATPQLAPDGARRLRRAVRCGAIHQELRPGAATDRAGENARLTDQRLRL